jgi:hypothetical protein
LYKEGKKMIDIKMGKMSGLVYIVSVMFMVILLTSCVTMGKAYHKYLMKGNIIETYNSDIYLCIGSNDGAEVGQELDVYKITIISKARSTFQREHTGKVKITEIVDEHFAKAKVISGKAEKHDIVELISH